MPALERSIPCGIRRRRKSCNHRSSVVLPSPKRARTAGLIRSPHMQGDPLLAARIPWAAVIQPARRLWSHSGQTPPAIPIVTRQLRLHQSTKTQQNQRCDMPRLHRPCRRPEWHCRLDRKVTAGRVTTTPASLPARLRPRPQQPSNLLQARLFLASLQPRQPKNKGPTPSLSGQQQKTRQIRQHSLLALLQSTPQRRQKPQPPTLWAARLAWKSVSEAAPVNTAEAASLQRSAAQREASVLATFRQSSLQKSRGFPPKKRSGQEPLYRQRKPLWVPRRPHPKRRVRRHLRAQ